MIEENHAVLDVIPDLLVCLSYHIITILSMYFVLGLPYLLC
jgi:hypothetical protein